MIYSAASIILQEPIQASAAHVEETDEGRFKVVWYGFQWGGDFAACGLGGALMRQQPNQSDADFYRALDRQLTRYENTKGRDAGIRATAVQREMRDLWARMDDSSKAAVKTWREAS